METFYFLLIIMYILNLFYGLKFLFKNNFNLSNMLYTFLLLLIFPFVIPIVYLMTFLDEQIRRKLIKKREIDKKHLKEIKSKPISQHNDVQIFNNGEQLFDDIIEEIERAEHFIHMSFFTFNTDQIGKRVIKKLEEKLKQNVDVKILYDPLGSKDMRKKHLKNFIKLGGEFIPFVKLKWRFININYRNHRKILIIDNKVSYIGGYNIGDKYLGQDKKLGVWVDCQLKIIGQGTSELEKRFLLDYMYCTKQTIDMNKYLIDHPFDGHHQMKVIASGIDINNINEIEQKFLEYIYKAEKYIYIQTPYLILNDAFIRALKYAALRGVEIKIMIPNQNDHLFVLQATKSYASQLLCENIKIYLFSKNAFLHSKVFLSDDYYVSIGTTNMDIRSFKFNLEINTFIHNSDLAKYTKTMFNKQMSYCTEYKISNISIIQKTTEDLCKLLSTIL